MQSTLRHITSAPRLMIWTCLALVVLVAANSLVSADLSWAALCRALPVDAGYANLFAMWAAMALAMMLPTAFPMISAYLDIAEAARAKAMPVVPPMFLAGGYAVVWLAFAAGAAALQLTMADSVAPHANRIASGGLFVVAGLYQFAPLKHACLTKCRRPMPYFMAHWTTEPMGVFRMGLHQGTICLGCCWALMMLGLAAGFMNLAWMAGLAAIMVLEKTLPEPKPVIYGLGIGLIAAGVVMIGTGA